MHNLGRALLLCGVAACTIAACAQDQSAAAQWSAEISFANRDVWRGILDAGPTSSNAVTYSRGTWEVSATAVVELSSLEKRRNVEVDLDIARRWKLRRGWSWALGYDYYGTPRKEDEHGYEFWTGAEYSGRIDFSMKAYQFAAPHTGSYFSAEAGRDVLKSGRFSLRADTAVGFNRHMYIDRSTFSDASVTLTPAVRIAHGSLQPFVMLSKGLDRRYFDDHVVFGVKYVLG